MIVSNIKNPLPSWQYMPARYLFGVLNGSTPLSSEKSYWDGNIYWATPQDIGALKGKLILDTQRKITEEGYENSGTQIAPVSSIVLTTRAPVGNLALAGVPLCTNQGCKVLVPRTSAVNSSYFYYQLLARKNELSSFATGTTFQELGTTELNSFQLYFPSLFEQNRISSYLDRETQKIDALIAAKKRLLELLGEKRRSLITHTVTRGLNADAPMQDSGIEWLGKIPKHWHLAKIKHVAIIGNGSTPLRDEVSYWKNGSFPWLTSTVVNDDIVDKPTEFVTEIALRECHLPIVKPNSILIAITGQGKTRGKATLLNCEATINQHMAFITPWEKALNPKFLQFFLISQYEFLRMISEGMGSTKGALTCEQVADFIIALPSLVEQEEIISSLQGRIDHIDQLSSVTTDAIALLQERRTSLISATVTGQHPIPD
jgi:type I restriction enzyme, S subunit